MMNNYHRPENTNGRNDILTIVQNMNAYPFAAAESEKKYSKLKVLNIMNNL